MSPLWTPNSPSDVAAGLQIVVPETEPRKVWRCNVCGGEFNENAHAAFERHVVRCAKRHEDELMEALEQRQKDTYWSEERMEEQAYVRRQAALKGVVGKGITAKD